MSRLVLYHLHPTFIVKIKYAIKQTLNVNDMNIYEPPKSYIKAGLESRLVFIYFLAFVLLEKFASGWVFFKLSLFLLVLLKNDEVLKKDKFIWISTFLENPNRNEFINCLYEIILIFLIVSYKLVKKSLSIVIVFDACIGGFLCLKCMAIKHQGLDM